MYDILFYKTAVLEMPFLNLAHQAINNWSGAGNERTIICCWACQGEYV
uniref:Uncharacterized protein n=1 Tax=Arundo donax TaxID=35708 RepID=A0A0A9BMI9_ARUDO